MARLDLREYTNRSFDPFFACRARELVCYGGAGAGKSYAVAQKLIMKALLYPGSRIAVIRKFGPSLKKTCWELTIGLLDKYGIPYKPNLSDLTIELGQSKMEFMPVVNSSGEPAERLKSMTDITDIWVEEATEITPEEYRQIRLRLRGEELTEGYRQIVLSFNPIDRNHWIYAYFFEGDRGEKQKYTYKDNRFIDSDYKAELEGLKGEDEILYHVYTLGDWGVLGKIIYTRYEIAEFDHPAGYYDELLAGCDFGFVHPSAVVFMGLKEKTAYIIDEIYERKLITAELVDRIGEKQEEHRLAPAIFCDSAEPGRIEEMTRAGLNVWPADKNVADGIDTVKGYRLVIHPRCVSTIREIRSYARKKDRAGNVLEEPVKANDHACLCAGTMIETDHGGVPIEDIRPGDMVLTRKGYRAVIESGITDMSAEVMRVEFSDGRELTGTGNHPVYVLDKGYSGLRALRYGDSIEPVEVWKEGLVQCARTLRGEKSLPTRESVSEDIQMPRTRLAETILHPASRIDSTASRDCIRKSGKITTAPYRRATMSTTRTATPLTMILRTLSASLMLSIWATTSGKTRGKFPRRQGRQQPSGTGQKRDGLGIASLASWLGKIAVTSRRSASIAVSNMKSPQQEPIQGSARMPVSLLGAGPRGSTMKLGYARSATKSSSSTNIQRKDSALVHVRRVITGLGRKPVYNLSVEEPHEYFANGVLVHNCDAIRYALHSYEREMFKRGQQQAATVVYEDRVEISPV